MRIGICGTQCNGKSTLLKAFLEKWPSYETPEDLYRKSIKEHNLSLNKEGNLESQKIIRESLSEMAIQNASKSKCIHDRTILDNLVYTLWLAEKGIIKDEDFIANSFHITRHCMSMFDIIFWLPLNEKITLTEKENRDTDPEFREEIDSIYNGIFESYKAWEGLIFPQNDSATMIKLTSTTVSGKLKEISDYLDDQGDLIVSDSSVFTEIEDFYTEIEKFKDLTGENPESK